MQTPTAKIHSAAVPKELQGYIHEDFRKNEAFYWKTRNKLLKQYRGKWIAVHNGEVIVVGDDIFQVMQEVGKRNCHAYITKVGAEDKIVFKRRRAEFAYNTDYPGLALPQTRGCITRF